jgi:hypothetical protein
MIMVEILKTWDDKTEKRYPTKEIIEVFRAAYQTLAKDLVTEGRPELLRDGNEGELFLYDHTSANF